MSFKGNNAPLDQFVRSSERFGHRLLGWFDRTGVAGKLAVAAVMLLLIAVAMSIQISSYLAHLDLVSKWAKADSQFRSAGYLAATDSYYEVLLLLKPDPQRTIEASSGTVQRAGRPSTEIDFAVIEDAELRDATQLAAVMHDLCHELTRLETSLSENAGDAAGSLRELAELRQRLLPDSSSSGEAALINAIDGMKDKDGLAVGPSFQRHDRWDEVVTDLLIRGVKLAETQSQAFPPDAHALNSLNLLIRLLEVSGADVSVLKQNADTGRRTLDYYREQEAFLSVATQAEKSLREEDISRAHGTWQSICERFAARAESHANVWDDYQRRLQSRLTQEIKSFGGDAIPPRPGRLDGSGPPILPTREFAALIPAYTVQKREPGFELVFVQYDDRCYALDAATGDVRWICVSGYDARWLPQQFTLDDDDLVVLVWEQASGQSITVAQAADLTPLWSWHLPQGESLAGPPYVRDSRMYLWLQSGALWQCSTRDGVVEGVLKLPHAAGGPLAVRPDGRGAAVTDRQLAVYIIDFQAVPVLHDVVLPESGGNTLETRPVWVPPFLLVFENQLTDQCRVIVLREFDDAATLNSGTPSPQVSGVDVATQRSRRATQYRVVHREQLTGRLWQTPSVYGTSMLIASDLGSESVHRLQLQGSEPLFTVFKQSGRPREWPLLPYTLMHSQSPFVAALEGRVIRYDVNPLVAQIERQREVAWEFSFPLPDTVPLQPLQATSNGVLAVGQTPGGEPAFVTTLDFAAGTEVWSSRIGNRVEEIFAKESGAPAIIRTTTGMMLNMTAWSLANPRRLASVSANETVDYSGRNYSLGWVETSPPEFRLVSPEGSLQKMIPLANPAAAPIALFDDALITDDSNPNVQVPGPWAAVLDTERQLHLIPLRSSKPANFSQFSRELPAAGWWRPAWLDGKAILLSHPDGHLGLFKLAEVGGIVYPDERRMISLSAGLAAAPVWKNQSIWVAGRDSILREFSPNSLEVRNSVVLPDRPTSPPTIGSSAILAAGMANGRVAIVSTLDYRILSDTPVSKYAIVHVVLTPDENRILVFDSFGKISELDLSGTILRRSELRGAVSATPVWYGGSLLVPTTAGDIHVLESSTFK